MKIAPTLPALRIAAREKLRALPSVPGPSEVEWTAVVLAESALGAVSAAPAAKEQGWLTARAAAAGILTPELAVVLNQVDEKTLMPFVERQGKNRIQMIGRGLQTLTNANRAAGLECTSRQGFALLGVRTPQEKETLEAALDETIAKIGLEKLKAVADRFELATALGQLKADSSVVGLAGDRTVALERSLLSDPKLLQIKLDHEIGHLVDQHLASGGWRSHGADTPFGKGETVSEYARLNAHEDFAETHAVLLRDWDELKENPWRSVCGEKMAWILEHAYGVEVGEPPSAEEAFDHLMTTRRLEHDPAQDWKIIGAGQATAREALCADLHAGGEGLLKRLRSHVEGLAPAERDRMNYRLDRAWAEVRLKG